MDRKQSESELKMWVTKPSEYNSLNPFKTLLGDGKICFSPDVVMNQSPINNTNQPHRMSVLLDLDIFSKGFNSCITKRKKLHLIDGALVINYFNSVITTRLFCPLPNAEALSATGSLCPFPSINWKRLAGIPFCLR